MHARIINRHIAGATALILIGCALGAWWVTRPSPRTEGPLQTAPDDTIALPSPTPPSAEQPAPPIWLALATEVYRTDCLGCHRAGAGGALVAEALSATTRALLEAEGGAEYLALLMLFGSGGQPEGASKVFRHPPYANRRTDHELAAVLNLTVGLDREPPFIFTAPFLAAHRTPPRTREEVLSLRPAGVP